jgi:hypothetical protein
VISSLASRETTRQQMPNNPLERTARFFKRAVL